MNKIVAIFNQVLRERDRSAISFKFADEEHSSAAAKNYWELLNQLSESINARMNAFGFISRIIIKDEGIVSIETYIGDKITPEITPYGIFSITTNNDYGPATEVYTSFNKAFPFLYHTATQSLKTKDMEQVNILHANLEKELLDYIRLNKAMEYYKKPIAEIETKISQDIWNNFIKKGSQ